jgi:hypothetical protein
MKLTRRHILRGAGVALALPWLESFAPRPARGQTRPTSLRFVALYFPMGTASFWTPTGVGRGDAWQLSPILEPLAPLKSKLTVLSHVDNTAYGPLAVRPAYPRDTAGFLTCAPAQVTPPLNGVSVDQVIARGLFGAVTPLPSLQLGLSTLSSFTEDLPPAFSRSISWSSPSTALGKIIDPQAVFDRLVAARGDPLAPMDPAAEARRAKRQSVLDFVLGDATSIQPRLSYTDRARLDQFMTSVRDLEQRVQATPPPPPPGCVPVSRPAEAIAVNDVPADYNRDAHATTMIDLMVLALACDVTHVVSFMFDDARSDFVYNFIRERSFTAAGSTPGTAPVGGFHGLAQGAGLANNGYATINFWFVSKLAELGQKLAALPDGPQASVLDNSVIWFGSGMNNGRDQALFNLPLAYLGGAGGVLKTDAHIDFSTSGRLSDVYLTFIQNVFRLPDQKFADSQGFVTDLFA